MTPAALTAKYNQINKHVLGVTNHTVSCDLTPPLATLHLCSVYGYRLREYVLVIHTSLAARKSGSRDSGAMAASCRI